MELLTVSKLRCFHFQLVLKRVGSPPINSYSTLNFLDKSTVLKWSFHLPTNPSITSRQSNELLLLFSRSLTSDSATPRTVTRQAPLSVRFPRQEYWSGLPFPNPGIKPVSLVSPALAGGFFTTSATWEDNIKVYQSMGSQRVGQD